MPSRDDSKLAATPPKDTIMAQVVPELPELPDSTAGARPSGGRPSVQDQDATATLKRKTGDDALRRQRWQPNSLARAAAAACWSEWWRHRPE